MVIVALLSPVLGGHRQNKSDAVKKKMRRFTVALGVLVTQAFVFVGRATGSWGSRGHLRQHLHQRELRLLGRGFPHRKREEIDRVSPSGLLGTSRAGCS